jgi:hypothetical protein
MRFETGTCIWLPKLPPFARSEALAAIDRSAATGMERHFRVFAAAGAHRVVADPRSPGQITPRFTADHAVRRTIVNLVPALAFVKRFVPRDQGRVAFSTPLGPASRTPNRLPNAALGVETLFRTGELKWLAAIDADEFKIVQRRYACFANISDNREQPGFPAGL